MADLNLTQQEFTRADHQASHRIARALGYSQFAYTSTSALIGLFCMAENPEHVPDGPRQPRAIIKTKELGFLVVQDLEDLGIVL